MREYGLFIDGKFVSAASGETFDSPEPGSGHIVARVSKPGVRDARRAIEAARRAFDDGSWSDRTPEARRDMIHAVCDSLWDRQAELAELEARDAGLTIRYATVMVASAIQWGRQLADLTAKIPLTQALPHMDLMPAQTMQMREPYGVCTLIVPFNAPLVLTAWKLFPALAAGNTVILKPSPYTPCTAMELALAFSESDVPPGVFNVLPGGGAEVGEELVTNPLVDRVAFTGSTEVGRRIMQLASGTLKHVTLELGGKSANVILDDADLEIAVPGAVWSGFAGSGQVCQAGSRLLVPDALHDEVVERIVEAVTQLRTGDPLSWETDLGPVVSQAQLDRIERYVRSAREDGATLICGGHRLADDGLRDGFFYAPTVFTNVRNDMRIAQEEIFGPVLSVIRYSTVDEAVRIANDSVYGLAGAIWSRDVPRALNIARKIKTGMLWINEYHVLDPTTPYGGFKHSGLGKELGIDGCLEYFRSKTVWVDQGRTLRSKVWAPLLGIDRIFGITYE